MIRKRLGSGGRPTIQERAASVTRQVVKSCGVNTASDGALLTEHKRNVHIFIGSECYNSICAKVCTSEFWVMSHLEVLFREVRYD